LLSNLGTRFCLRGVGCDAPGFQLELVTLMSRSTALTLVKRRSTWAITSKTSLTNPNDTPWSTSGQGSVQTLVKPLEHPLTSFVVRNFCRILQISPKRFKISQCKSCVFCRGTTFMLSGIAGLKCKLVKNAGQRLQTLFTGAKISAKFHYLLCKIC
jgi:hypothetical protein